MTLTMDQTILFSILAGLFALLIWGRWRYDLVAFSALMVSIVAGVVPVEHGVFGLWPSGNCYHCPRTYR